MGYDLPSEYSRLTVEFDAISPMGSLPSWGITVNADPDLDVLSDVRDYFTAHLLPNLGNEYRTSKVVMRGNETVEELAFSEAGTYGGDTVDPQTSAIVKLTTGLTGRTHHGRIYLVGMLLDADVFNSGTIESDRVADLGGFVVGLADALITATGSAFYIGHSDGSVPTPVTNAIVEGQVATQRRRNRK